MLKMDFEFDPKKSSANLQKHGIDFEQAQTLWGDADGLEIPSKQPHEARKLWVAAKEGKLWTAIFTSTATIKFRDRVGRVTPCAPFLGRSVNRGAHGVTRPTLFAAVLGEKAGSELSACGGRARMNGVHTMKHKTTAENLETRFETGERVMDYFDLSKASRPLLKKERVNLDIPHWMVLRIDRI